ncbi:polysaccharide deacetylase family protein [Rothia halotolerans]|uniref:polysaccharide deacetylase family protein n=1 Tax=Rothia halotolerans TaxID=405770 RepID=UPI00101BB85C|nr:polysaccharide deacetylase family protein [Rothia halotolerans]
METKNIGQVMAEGTDMDTLRNADNSGLYYVPTIAVAESLINYPQPARSAVVEVLSGAAGSAGVTQLVYERDVDDPAVWRRTMVTAARWTPWERVDGASGGDGEENSTSTTTDRPETAALRNEILVQDFTRRYNVSTGGKGAVAFRFDHGLTNFKEIVLPLLRQHQLPAGIAMNSRTWANPNNAGVTQTEANAWVTTDRIEYWAHGATHKDAANEEQLVDEIVRGLEELRAQLPAATIDGFMIPGVGGTGYNGFNAGRNLKSFSATVAGQLILANHAVSSGYRPGTVQRQLDGVVRQGLSHYSWEKATLAGVKDQVDAAIKGKTGLVLMMHPQNIGKTGFVSPAVVEGVIAYVAAKCDAGELVALSPYQLSAARL